MNTYTWVGSAPKCEYCGGQMSEWYMFAKTHIHDHCLIARVSAKLQEDLKATFAKIPVPKKVVDALVDIAQHGD